MRFSAGGTLRALETEDSDSRTRRARNDTLEFEGRLDGSMARIHVVLVEPKYEGKGLVNGFLNAYRP